MNISDDRYRYCFFECGNQTHCLPIGDSRADDLAARLFELLRLRDRAFDILGGPVEHRLDADPGAAADFCIECGNIMFACHVNLR